MDQINPTLMYEREKHDAQVDAVIKVILEDLEIAKRTHVRTRQMVDDILWLRGENTKIQGIIESNSQKIGDLIEVTNQVRDILITFKVTNAIAKWVAAFGAACAAIYYGWIHIK